MRLITPAAAEPVTVTELARNLRLFTGDGEYTGPEQALLQALISSARVDAEHYTGRLFVPCDYQRVFRDFEPVMLLHHDLTGIISVQYYDVDNQDQALDQSQIDWFPAIDSAMFTSDDFPSVYQRGDAVRITFTAGVEEDKLDTLVKQAIIMIASHWYENREASSPLQVREVPLNYCWMLDGFSIHPRVA